MNTCLPGEKMYPKFRINAYVMAADPAFLEESVLSYYHLVNKIIVTYDINSIGWLGSRIPVDECLSKLHKIDKDRKCVYIADDFSYPQLSGVESDTAQRQVSLDAAGEDADWVLQLDTDEVLSDSKTFISCLQAAEKRNATALHYPLRFLFAHLGGSRYLEKSSRLWSPVASYPGPVAVRPGTVLTCCRQTDALHYRVDFKPVNTDTSHPKDAHVDQVIDPDSAIWHYSWVRDKEHMLRKAGWSTHAKDFNWNPLLRYWLWSQEHPVFASLLAPVVPPRKLMPLRITDVNEREPENLRTIEF